MAGPWLALWLAYCLYPTLPALQLLGHFSYETPALKTPLHSSSLQINRSRGLLWKKWLIHLVSPGVLLQSVRKGWNHRIILGGSRRLLAAEPGSLPSWGAPRWWPTWQHHVDKQPLKKGRELPEEEPVSLFGSWIPVTDGFITSLHWNLGGEAVHFLFWQLQLATKPLGLSVS